MKLLKYFIQALIIYFCIFLIFILRLRISRKIFSKIFQKIGPLIQSNKILGNYNEEKKDNIKLDMWSNYGKTFVEYLFLKKFRKNKDHIQIWN